MARVHPGFTVALRVQIRPLSILDGINPMQVCTLGTKHNVIAQVAEWDKRAGAGGILASFGQDILQDMHDSDAHAQLATWGDAFRCFVLTYVDKDGTQYCAIGDYTKPNDYKVYRRLNDVLTWVHDEPALTFELNKCFVDAHRCCLVRHDGKTHVTQSTPDEVDAET